MIKCPINYLDVDYPFKLLKAIGNPESIAKGSKIIIMQPEDAT